MSVTVTREIEDADVADWLRSVPESVLAAYRRADEQTSRAKLLESMRRMRESFRANRGSEQDLSDILDLDEEELGTIFRG